MQRCYRCQRIGAPGGCGAEREGQELERGWATGLWDGKPGRMWIQAGGWVGGQVKGLFSMRTVTLAVAMGPGQRGPGGPPACGLSTGTGQVGGWGRWVGQESLKSRNGPPGPQDRALGLHPEGE